MSQQKKRGDAAQTACPTVISTINRQADFNSEAAAVVEFEDEKQEAKEQAKRFRNLQALAALDGLELMRLSTGGFLVWAGSSLFRFSELDGVEQLLASDMGGRYGI